MLLALAIAGLFVLPDPWRVVFLALALVVEIAEIPFWLRVLRRYRVRTGAEGMLGEPALALDDLAPEGRVRLRGHEIWNAIAAEPIAAGEELDVVAVEGLRVRVARRAASRLERGAR